MIYPPEVLDGWRALLELRVEAARQTEEEYVAAARAEHRAARKWFASTLVEGPAPGKAPSFAWVCDVLDIEASAVRRALKEPK